MIGIPALAVTSLTPKEEVPQVYQCMEQDKTLRLLYGACSIFALGQLAPAMSSCSYPRQGLLYWQFAALYFSSPL